MKVGSAECARTRRDDGADRSAPSVSRRRFIKLAGGAAVLVALGSRPRKLVGAQVAPSRALRAGGTVRYDLVIDHLGVRFTGDRASALAVNGMLPAPLLRLREGDDVMINVTNRLDEDTSIHWHGLLLPANMDGVPVLSFGGIRPGETFTYRFPINQSGTYWYHSHSGGQEQKGLYGPIVIEPAGADPYRADRDYVVMLSDWTDDDPERILGNLKKDSDYYNYSRPTLSGFIHDLFNPPKGQTRGAVLDERMMWAKMRMQRTDISDVSGYTFLLNGKTAEDNWTGVFAPGDRVRLRVINGSSMTFFDLKIPGLRMTVIQADGQDVEPVEVDEIRVAVAETYDVLVEPEAGRAYTIFAQAMDRTGYARGTLAEREGMSAPIPAMDPRPVRTMADMGGMGGMHMGHTQADSTAGRDTTMMHDMPGMEGMAMPDSSARHAPSRDSTMDHMVMHGISMDHMSTSGPGTGNAPLPRNLASAGLPTTPGWRTLMYRDLRARTANADVRSPERDVELRLTGDMQRYFWTINGKKLSESVPIELRRGERVRLTFINETMMDHPMHLHGVFMELQNGAEPAYAPRKHTISVPPATTIETHFTALEPGMWALHCHLLYHMMTGMFARVAIGAGADGVITDYGEH
jgi:CopA family copper-resistance protein